MTSVRINPCRWHSPGWAAIVVLSGDADSLQVSEFINLPEIPIYSGLDSIELKKVVCEFDVRGFYEFCTTNCINAVVYSYDFNTITYAIL